LFKKIGRLMAAVVLGLGLLAGVYYWPAAELPPRLNDRFGLAFINTPDNLAGEARYQGGLEAGARWNRWPLYWHWVAESGYAGSHEGGGQHDYDSLVAADMRHGIQPLVILIGTPRDEARPPEQPLATPTADLPLPETSPELSSATLPPHSLNEPIFADGSDDPGPGKTIHPGNAWARFVFETVQRYRPGGQLARQRGWPANRGVRHWEIWNEPDFDLFWRGSVADYYRLLEVGYQAVKQADPAARVLLGGLAYYEKPAWLGEFLRYTGGEPGRAYFDIFSVHHYWSVYNSEARLRESRALLEAYGLKNVPLWITESGLSVWDDFPATAYGVDPDTPWRGTRAEQAAYVLQHSALAFYQGVDRYFHFMLHDDCGDGLSTAYGLRQNFSPHPCNPAIGQPRPAYAAYQLAAEQLDGLEPLWRTKSDLDDQVAFYRPADRSRVLLVWATQGLTVTTAISATGDQARLYWIDAAGPAIDDPPPVSGAGSDGLAAGFRRQSLRAPAGGVYYLELPAATNQNAADPNDFGYYIGGRPYLLVERDTEPPTAVITGLPASSPAEFVVSWQGEDLGSGVAAYDLWVGQDEAALEPWLRHITATQAVYAGEIGHTYRFAVRARDQAGNEAPVPLEAQASTETVETPLLSGVVLGPGRKLVAGATVVIEGENMQRLVATRADGTWPATPLPVGPYTVQVYAPQYGVWPAVRSIELPGEPNALGRMPETTLLLTLPPADNAIAGGDFEGLTVWQPWDWAGQVDRYFRAFDGRLAARLGAGQGEPATCANGRAGRRWSIQQWVTISNVEQPVLSFVYQASAALADEDEARFDVKLVTEQAEELLTSPAAMPLANEWRLASFDLSPWRGQRVGVQFEVMRCAEGEFEVLLDRVSLGARVGLNN
jgi:hypothetical protein